MGARVIFSCLLELCRLGCRGVVEVSAVSARHRRAQDLVWVVLAAQGRAPHFRVSVLR